MIEYPQSTRLGGEYSDEMHIILASFVKLIN